MCAAMYLCLYLLGIAAAIFLYFLRKSLVNTDFFKLKVNYLLT